MKVKLLKKSLTERAELLFKLPLFVSAWVTMAVIRIPLTVIGWVALPIALRSVEYERLPKWAWIWGNDEDGLDGPPWYRNRNPDWSKNFRRYIWLGWRNRVHNLREVRWIKLKLVPSKVRYVGSSLDINPSNARFSKNKIVWHLAWQGFLRSGFWIIWAWKKDRHSRFFIGWKVRPHHKLGVSGYAFNGVGYGFQFLPFRKG